MLDINGFNKMRALPVLKPRKVEGRIIGEAPKDKKERIEREAIAAVKAKQPVSVSSVSKITNSSATGIRTTLDRLVESGVMTSKKIKIPEHTRPMAHYSLAVA